MRVLLAFHEMTEWGGIVQHAEHLAAGLKALGHEVEALQAVPASLGDPYKQAEEGPGELGLTWGQFGYRFGKRRVDVRDPRAWHRAVKRYDLVIWEFAVPTTKPVWSWRELYQVEVPQLAVVHDGSLRATKPWFDDIAGELSGIVAVHPCGVTDMEGLPERGRPQVALVPNPLPPAPDPAELPSRRQLGFLSHQFWRPEKRVDDLLRACLVMDKKLRRIVAGDGIERRYMRSKDKCPEKYRGLFHAAVAAGVEMPGWISAEERDRLLTEVTAHVDPAWGKAGRAPGAQFNRGTLEAMRMGAVPVAHVRSAGAEILQPNEHYVPLPELKTFFGAAHTRGAPAISPEDYAAAVERACRLSEAERRRYRANARCLLQYFERKWVAQEFLKLAAGRPAGLRLAEQKGK